MSALFSGRALTLRAPWPFAVHALDKGTPGLGCENRTRPPPAWLVGPDAPMVALHSGSHIATLPEWRLLWQTAREAGWFAGPRGEFVKGDRSVRMEPVPRASILGVFRILSVDPPGQGDLTGWRVPDCYAYRIDYRPLPAPLPCSGPTPKPGKDRSTNLGWWAVPAAVRESIEAALAARSSP